MSKIKELIEKLCPNGVEYKKIIDITIWDKKFNGIDNEYKKGYKHISAEALKKFKSEIGTIKLLSTGAFDGYAEESECKEFINKGEIITLPSGGTANIKYYNGQFLDSGNILAISKNKKLYNLKYIYYNLINIQPIVQSYYRGSGVKHPDMNSILNISIPVPPLEVQCEIVHVLDKFAKYKDCLEKELKCREKQLEYIMKKELDTNEPKNYVTLGELCKIEKGKTALQKANPGEYPLVATTEHLQSCDNYQFDCEAVCMPLISARGHGVASITRIFYQKGKFALGNILCAIMPKTNVIKVEFLRHYLYYYKDVILVPLMTGGANVSLTIDDLKNVKVLVPSIEEQEKAIYKINKIYEILDKKHGIPAEIEARQKQYEYYRDKLLTFKELKNEG